MIVCDRCHKQISEKDVQKVVECKGRQAMKADFCHKCYDEFINFASKKFNVNIIKINL